MQMNEKQTLLAGAAALELGGQHIFRQTPDGQLGLIVAVLPAQAESAPEPTREEQGPVNINTASAEELMRLPGIGQAKAEAILADRAANGPYAAPEDLTRVKGISQRMVQQWGSDITVGG
mgnify:CR=1 FL=1